MTDSPSADDEAEHGPDPSPAEEREAFRIYDTLYSSAKPLEGHRPRRRPQRRLAFFSRSEELSRATLKLRERQQNIDLKRLLAFFAIIAVSAQLLFADALFGWYVWQTLAQHATVEPQVLIAWLSATVVEVIGIVLVIARNLFPAPRSRRQKPASPEV